MSTRLTSSTAALLTLTLGAAAQSIGHSSESSLPYVEFDHEQTTGWVSNDAAHSAIVASLHVEVPNAESLRLLFGEVELAGGFLRLTSLADGGVQTLDQRGLQQWNSSTAWFNGGAVLLDLVLEAGAGPAIATVASLEVGVAPSVVKSQCGPVDDREPSSDPRVARLLPSGCTAWIINDCAKCFLSAGHCGTGNNVVEFNVPFSDLNGSWNHPPPSDQYPIDAASIQSHTGFGNDWLYFGTFPNSTTGLSAFEAQGAAFDLVNPPSTAGNTIRITGHGADFTPDGTYNQIQQTHSGPFVSSGSPLTYQADTEGGNSGSPVIWDEQDVAIGIHTNAGCSTGGGGANSGTNILQVDLQAALDNPQGQCATGGLGGAFADLGNGLFGFPFGAAPVLAGCGTLEPSTAYQVILTMPDGFGALASASSALLIAGFDQIDLPFLGGTIVPSLDVLEVVPMVVSGVDVGATIDGTWPPAVPGGTTLYAQYWIPYVGVLFGDGVVASNALSLTAP